MNHSFTTGNSDPTDDATRKVKWDEIVNLVPLAVRRVVCTENIGLGM